MDYRKTRLCSGSANKAEPCEHIDNCDLCINTWTDDNENEYYIIGRGCNFMECKRDSQNYKPLTKAQFIEFYKQMPNRTNTSLGDLLESLKNSGMVES